MNNNQFPLLTDRFQKALVYATQLHAQQVRKGSNVPYISHLLSVAALVLEDGGDEDEAIAGLLHDAIEDQGGEATRQEICRQFGDRVAEIVEGCTDSDTIPKPPWRERKQAYIERFPRASSSVRRVSLADKLHNARSLVADYYSQKQATWNKFKGGREGTLWYYRSIIEAARQAGECGFLLEELETVVQYLENCA
ncbi:metal dependent phosphohydrolase (plasmid) [Gloeothece citriformis PCC 7424]|uniref:Metal dependent phosphohydrolase n=1 Tax=Gloeothece citriformis (strain PCC 7424) TaxID=65393 RepID=B7KM71_GLOC7|nr:HD domain-containing protein [Gloeothece citriformis]ACK73893.1 metal dependent phosphohydrolase [Gloeothece citriformis PCC 7424]